MQTCVFYFQMILFIVSRERLKYTVQKGEKCLFELPLKQYLNIQLLGL